MPYSPTLSAETSTGGKLVTILLNLEQNASSQEKPMLMVEFIYTLLSISGPDVNSGRAGAMYSMLEASTQTFHQRTVHHKVASTTRAKMATLSQGDLRDRREALNLAQMLTGAQSSLHQLERSFLQLSWNNLHELCAPHSLLWRSTPIGDIGLIQSRISMTATYCSTLIHFQNSLHGHSSTLQDLQNQVSRRTSRRGTPPELRVPARASLARGDPPPPSRVHKKLTESARIRGKSLVLYGPTRTGKTTWARSLGRHAYFGGLFSLDENIADAEYAVFDDINGGIGFVPSYKWWLGYQLQFYATDKYRGKKMITWGRPAIWCSNEDPREDPKADYDWLNKNCIFAYVPEETPLFE